MSIVESPLSTESPEYSFSHESGLETVVRPIEERKDVTPVRENMILQPVSTVCPDAVPFAIPYATRPASAPT